MSIPFDHDVTRLDDLAALFGALTPATIQKEVDRVHPLYRTLIEASPFVVLATSGPRGLDASPRGDPPGFVVVEDDRTLLLPERRGNNRIDSLRNIVVDPRVALLFLVPGHGETLRVNGTARISVDSRLLDRLAMLGKRPQCVIVVTITTIFFQCARAIQRSRLWDAESTIRTMRLPTPGAILSALTGGDFDGTTYDRELPGRQRDTLY